ncbi:LysR family transcriptional regulator [Massilia sp. LXY-6]|uniref:LysR family transcriptional regulator n=1 Tax=Massilia sp. LXY-6 TaxID=3379823 RepID=UPI003EDF3CB6
MESKLIEYFLRVVELKSINRAAADLHLSQPALSRHIASLEHQIGARLFTRTQGGVVPTEAGWLLQSRARPVLRQLATLVEQVGERAAGQLSIGVPPSWQHLFTTRYISRLIDEYPGVSLRIYEGVSHELRESMQAGLLDLAIVPHDRAPPADYRYTRLVREPLVLVSSKTTGLDPGAPVPLSRLDKLALALPGRNNAIRAYIEDALLRAGFEFSLAFEIDAMDLSMELAREGKVHTVTPCCAVSASRRWKDDISWSPIRDTSFTWALCENTARSYSPAVREGVSQVFQLVDSIVASGSWLGAEPVGREAR